MTRVLKNIFVIVIVLMMCITISSCESDVGDYYVFENIDECKNIELYKSEDSIITVYDIPSADDNLGDLEYISFYGFLYESDDLDFEIFAYEFVDSESAKKYFKNETGLENVLDTHFLASGGMRNYSVIVIDDCKAYVAYTKQKYSEELESFLGVIFSKKIEI